MQPLRLLFDECCSKRLPGKLAEIYAEDYQIETKHLTEFFSKGDDDADWLPLIESGGWIVITTDRGKDPKKPKLPVICERLGINHLMFTSELLNAGYAAQKQALLCVWPQLVRITALPKGTGVMLGYRAFKHGLTMWPVLSIANKSFDAWCAEKNVSFPKI